jgi:5'-3' exonuclease
LFQQQFANVAEDTVIWVWEGRGGNNLRRNKFPDYKMNRVKPHEDIFASIKMFRDSLAYAPVYQVQVDGYEGDDAVASLTRWFCELGPVHIWSTDKDFRMLCTLPNVTCSANKIEGVEDTYAHLFKTLVGDPSDNIKGLKGFGKVAFQACNQQYLSNQFHSGNFENLIMDFTGMSPKHFNQLEEDALRMKLFWEITEFIDIPRDLLAKNILPPSTVSIAEGLKFYQRYLIG